MSGSAGLEGGSRDRLEDGLAPLDAEGRHDGGSEGALRGRGQGVAHEGGAERGSHGDYGVVRAESGECVATGVARRAHLQADAIVGLLRKCSKHHGLRVSV